MENKKRHPDYLIQQQKNYPISEIFKAYTHASNLKIIGIFALEHATIPNHYEISNIDIEKALEWFVSNFSEEIKNTFHTKRELEGKKNELQIDDIFLQAKEDAIIYFDRNMQSVELCFRKCPQEWIDTVVEGIFKFTKQHVKNQIGIITKGRQGMDIDKFDVQSIDNNLALNYNDDLFQVHDVITNRLKKDKDKGIVLLHGEPGTGKTSYIRHLIGQIDKEVIFVSAHVAEHLNSPDFMSLLISHKNSVLVIEDAERILTHRDYSQGSPVATLLNLSDGLLSDCLNIQLICSFNTDISKIDKALLRKGRLIAKYEFKALSTEKANKLADKLKLGYYFSEPTKLTDIYNKTDLGFDNTVSAKAVGF